MNPRYSPSERAWVFRARKPWLIRRRFGAQLNVLQNVRNDELVEVYNPENSRDREPTWSDTNPEGRWHRYDYETLLKRDKVNLGLFWLKDESLENAAGLPDLEEIAEDLQSALDQFSAIANGLKSG